MQTGMAKNDWPTIWPKQIFGMANHAIHVKSFHSCQMMTFKSINIIHVHAIHVKNKSLIINHLN
jgi:hypothetical protein